MFTTRARADSKAPACLNSTQPGYAIPKRNLISVAVGADTRAAIVWHNCTSGLLVGSLGEVHFTIIQVPDGWIIRRVDADWCVKTLASFLGDLVICCRTLGEAKLLAESCHPHSPDQLGQLYWSDVSQ
jgi:hypothetical protein